MKKLLLLFITIITLANASYASFPITDNNTELTSIVAEDEEDDDNEPNSIRKDSFNSDDPSFVFHRENPENSGLYVPLITEIDHIDDFSQEHNPDLYLNEKNLMNYLQEFVFYYYH